MVDTSVHNPSRIARVPGTVNLKGNQTSRLLHVPESFATVERGQLEDLASLSPSRVPKERKQSDAASLREALIGRGISVAREKRGVGCDILQLTDCPFYPDETHTQAAALYVWDNGDIGFSCQGGRCKTYPKKGLSDLLDLLGLERRSVAAPSGGLKWTLASQIRTESVSFLWDKRLVAGHVNLILGNEKIGRIVGR
jgi:hypothetical protein